MLLVAVVRLVGQAEAGLGQVHQIARRVLGVGVDVDARRRRRPRCAATRRAPRPAPREFGAVDGGQFVAAAAAHPARPRRVSSMKLAYRSPMRCSSVPVGALLAAAASMIRSRTCSSARSYSDRNAPSVARSAGHLVVGQPAAVDMAEQVVLWAGIGVDVAQVDTGPDRRCRSAAHRFYRHPTRVPDRSRQPRG